MRALRAMLGPAAILVSGACATVPQSGDPFARVPGDEPVQVRVENDNWADMVIYAGREGGPMVRLGTVTSLGTRTFRLPPAVLGGSARVRLGADPIGGRATFQTDPIAVSGGETIRLSLRNQLSVSGYSVQH